MSINERNKGWITIWRKITDSEIWIQEPWRLKTWLYFLLEANHSEKKKYGQRLARGQIYISSIEELCKEVGCRRGYIINNPSVNSMKHFWKWLRDKQMVDTKKTTRGSIVSIINYQKYQNQVKPVSTNISTKIDTNQTPTIPHDRQQCKQLNKEEYSSYNKKKKPYFRGEEMRKDKRDKWWVIPKDGDSWLEFAGSESEIEWE